MLHNFIYSLNPICRFKTPDHFDYDDLERKYWRNLAYNSPIYGADVSGTIYDKDWDIWNINRLQTVLDVIEEEEGNVNS